MKRSGLALLVLILAAALVLFLFTNRMKKMKDSAPSGENAVRQAQEAVDALNDRLKQAYPDE